MSGKLDKALSSGETLQVFTNGTLIGTAVVNGTDWEISDTNAYSAAWSYTAKVTNVTGSSAVATQNVTMDLSEAAPVITKVLDSASASIANAGTTTNGLSSVSGTGTTAGDIIYLYDNSVTNLIGTATVDSSLNWTVSGLSLAAGSQTFAAKEYDTLKNLSVMSNNWTVTAGGNNMLTNGDFSQGNTGFTLSLIHI